MHPLFSFICLFLLFLLAGCNATPEYNAKTDISRHVNSDFATQGRALLDPSHHFDDVLVLSDSQKQGFFNFQQQQLSKGYSNHEIVSNYVRQFLFEFEYEHKTNSAEETLRLNRGNCMSYALVTAAFAELAGVEYEFKEVQNAPIFHREGELVWVVGHLQTKLYDPDFVEKKGYVYLDRPALILDYLPDSASRVSATIDKSEFMSIYYRNKAAELIVQDELLQALAYTLKAFEISPSRVENANLLAILHRMLGDEASAENIYTAAMKMDVDSLAVLNNYKILLVRQIRLEEAEKLERMMTRLDDPNPYRVLAQGYRAFNSNKFGQATAYFLKVIEKAPYIKEAHLGLYQIELAKGNLDKAKLRLSKVLPWIYDKSERHGLKRKLWALNNEA